MKNICCTIVTPSHIYKGITTLRSIRKHDDAVTLYLIVTEPVKLNLKNINILNLEPILENDETGQKIADIYSDQADQMRWSLKPIVMRYLLDEFPEANVIYCDCDLCFFSKPTDLYNYIEQGGIVLTPMWRPTDPWSNTSEFLSSFTDGFFNAGCITANTKGLVALDWWARACTLACQINRGIGLYLDQRYLDLLLLYFPGIVVCRHKGYNVADWNVQLRDEFLGEHQDLKKIFDIVLVHFTGNTITRIEEGRDIVLEPYLVKYKEYLNESLQILADVDYQY